MYYIIEMQTQESGVSDYIVQQAETPNSADQIYHMVLSYAAVSSVYCHAVTMLRHDGSFIKHQTYLHPTVNEEEPQGEGGQT